MFIKFLHFTSCVLHRLGNITLKTIKVKWNYVQMQKCLFEVEGQVGVSMSNKKDIQSSIIIMIQQIRFLSLETHLILTHLIKNMQIYLSVWCLLICWVSKNTTIN